MKKKILVGVSSVVAALSFDPQFERAGPRRFAEQPTADESGYWRSGRRQAAILRVQLLCVSWLWRRDRSTSFCGELGASGE